MEHAPATIVTIPAKKTGFPDIPPDVIARCIAGDLDAFETIYLTFGRYLYSLAYRFHGNHSDAEDSLQEAFVQMFNNIRRFRGDAKFSSWLYRILINVCLSERRKRRTRELRTSFADEWDHPRSITQEPDVIVREILEREITNLPEQQRAVFLLHASEGFTHQEIASMLGIRTGTSKSNYHRARAALKRRLQETGIAENSI